MSNRKFERKSNNHQRFLHVQFVQQRMSQPVRETQTTLCLFNVRQNFNGRETNSRTGMALLLSWRFSINGKSIRNMCNIINNVI